MVLGYGIICGIIYHIRHLIPCVNTSEKGGGGLNLTPNLGHELALGFIQN